VIFFARFHDALCLALETVSFLALVALSLALLFV
jgi:hypothetical protein